MMTMPIDRILDRNATCPLCHRFYHNIDIHNNPIPSVKNKRSDGSLCQCAKGDSAREFRKMYRNEREEEKRAKDIRVADVLSMDERNRQYWKDKEVKR